MTPARRNGFDGLWSLRDMLEIHASLYLGLGASYAAMQDIFIVNGTENPLSDAAKARLQKFIDDMLAMCEALDMPISTAILKQRRIDPPTGQRELGLLAEVISGEMDKRLFLFVPPHRSLFYQSNHKIPDQVKGAFPLATQEIVSAGNCYALGVFTACVFHAMRALEHGLRALAADVGLTFDVQQWYGIINEIESKIGAMHKHGASGPDKASKTARLQFLSEAAKEFSYFKDGWRNHAAHAKVSYNEQQALSALNHVTAFLDQLSKQLSEP